MIRSYKYRLFTNANQERELSIALETHRRLYNAALDGRMLCWDTAGVDWGFYDQCRWLTVQRKLNPYLASTDRMSCEDTLRRLDRAFGNFFRCVKAGATAGFPRFKSKDRFRSIGYREAKRGDWKIVAGKLRLPRIGTIRVRWHRALPDGVMKTLRLIREGGKWFASFAVEVADTQQIVGGSSVGIDVGLKSFITTSDGEQLGDSRHLERALPDLRRRQRALSRCKRGSISRQRAKQRVVALHAKVRNSRRDLHHKVAKSLVDRYGTIAAESLNIQGMLKNRRLARRISDAGWYSFIQILLGKAESAGSKVVLVDPKNTSQQCSNCGEIVRKSLAVRVHRCECGLVLDRDENAAINILARAASKDAKAGLLALS